MQGPRFLTPEQLLLTTLLVKLSVMAAAATVVMVPNGYPSDG